MGRLRELDLALGAGVNEIIMSEVMADLWASQRARARGQRYHADGIPGVRDEELRERERLLGQARRGDPVASRILWERYQLRLVKPEPTPAPEPVHPESERAAPKARHCDCGRPSVYKDGRCARCYNRDWKRAHGAKPLYRGPCRCGCSRPGRQGSGYAEVCYRRRYYGLRSLRQRWSQVTGNRHDLAQVRLELLGLEGTPAQQEALAAVISFLEAIANGEIVFHRNPWRGRRGRPAA